MAIAYMQKIFEIEDLGELERYLATQKSTDIRERLFDEFLRYAEYKNATEWNKAVRLCEALAIVGWGTHEALQAGRGKFFNGNPETGFYNKFDKPRFVNAIWSKRKSGLTMENGRTSYFQSPDLEDKPSVLSDYPINECIQDITLLNQRNWIPHAPVLITRGISNCYPSSKAAIDSIYTDLQPALKKQMRPEIYGNAIDTIIINCRFSYFDNPHCKTNHIIADEKLNIKQADFDLELLKLYSKQEIKHNGYYLRNRYEYGSLRNGIFHVNIYFEKELGDIDERAQKRKIAFHIDEALRTIVEKLKKKNLIMILILCCRIFNKS
ncbi:hypothetical protein FACS189487_11560 [Campylobacterota bacterium]|nr:hypothetical protein FACS189487_11560 [Campylobacterota bacterium]